MIQKRFNQLDLNLNGYCTWIGTRKWLHGIQQRRHGTEQTEKTVSPETFLKSPFSIIRAANARRQRFAVVRKTKFQQEWHGPCCPFCRSRIGRGRAAEGAARQAGVDDAGIERDRSQARWQFL